MSAWLIHLALSVLSVTYGPQPLAAPPGALIVTPTTPGVIWNAPPGATLYFKANLGNYNDLQIEPKDNQTYLAEDGVILTSSVMSYAFECFDRPANNVTIKNFIIDGYLPPNQAGVVQAGTIEKHGSNWNLINCEIKNCTWGGGACLFDGSTIEGCHFHNCDQIGFKMFGTGCQFLGNHVHDCNQARKYPVNNEAGGCKFWNTTNLVCSGNEFDHNIGCGIWLDNENTKAQIDHNKCHDNTYNGIYQEIGGSATIEFNTCYNNGLEFNLPGWLDGAGIAVEASHDVIVRNNTIYNNQNGIGLIATNRGDASWQIQNVLVQGNQLTGNHNQIGCCWDGQCPAPWTGSVWLQNFYQLPMGASFLWQGKSMTLQQWQAAGNN